MPTPVPSYSTVRKMIMVVVIRKWNKIRETQLVQDIMTDIAEGKMPHAGPVMTELLRRAALTIDPQDPSPA